MSESLCLIDHSVLYNLLQRHKTYPSLSDSHYLLLFDLRNEIDYQEDHIITAKRVKQNKIGVMVIPYDAELECKENIVLYDSNTKSLYDKKQVIEFGLLLWNTGSKSRINILSGGYEKFSACYPFLRSQKILYTPRELDNLELYPYEIIFKKLYLSNLALVKKPYVLKDLKITAFVNCTKDVLPTPKIKHVFHVPETERDVTTDLYQYFDRASYFIDNNQIVLIFSEHGMSCSVTILLAYIMYKQRVSLKNAYEFVEKCNPYIRPSRPFIHQLSKWEKHLFNGAFETDIQDPNF